MRIVRVITICAALISTFIGAETMRSKRWTQPTNHPIQSKPENNTNPDEVTFTTLRPEATLSSQKTHSNSYHGPNQRYLKVRSAHSMSQRLRGPNRFKGNRSRRQLQRSGAKMNHVGRSYETIHNENQIENQQIEAVQGPAEAFDKGAIHIEPIYRVTKNKNIFDSIVDVFRRIVEPPKSVGPLVGPFHFPGLKDKVYVRLLESIKPDNLVIRLISHLPVAETELTFDKNILPPSEIIEHAEGPPIVHESIVVTSDDHHDDDHSISQDHFSSSSNNIVQILKPSSTSSQKLGHMNGHSKEEHGLRMHKLNLKQGEPNGILRVVRHHNINPPMASAANSNRVNSILHLKFGDQVNKTETNQYLRANNSQNLYLYDQVYQFRLPMNESSKDNSKLLNLDFKQYHDPIIAPNSDRVVYSNPTAQFELFPNDQIVSNPQTPILNNEQVQSKNSYNKSTEDHPKYSIDFTSKNMRYLNLDGTVETAVTESSEERFKSIEAGPIFSKVPRSADNHWKPLRRLNAGTKETTESSVTKKDYTNLQERSDSIGETILEVHRKSSSVSANHSGNIATKKIAARSKE